jgi:hypothetical protein
MSLQGLPDSSRIWLFAADRVLSESEAEALQQDLTMFVAEWQAHGADLSAGFELRYGACLVIAVDESQAAPTGCSIDKAFRLLQRFGSEHKLDFFNRMLLHRPLCTSAVIKTVSQAQQALEDRDWASSTLVWNAQLAQLGEYRTNPFLPLSQSWAAARLTFS